MKYGIGSTSDASDLQVISRAVIKHFKGVEYIWLSPCVGGPRRGFDLEPRLCREGSIEEIAKAVKLLLKHPELKEVKVATKGDFSQLQEAVDKAQEDMKPKIEVHIVTGI